MWVKACSSAWLLKSCVEAGAQRPRLEKGLCPFYFVIRARLLASKYSTVSCPEPFFSSCPGDEGTTSTTSSCAGPTAGPAWSSVLWLQQDRAPIPPPSPEQDHHHHHLFTAFPAPSSHRHNHSCHGALPPALGAGQDGATALPCSELHPGGAARCSPPATRRAGRDWASLSHQCFIFNLSPWVGSCVNFGQWPSLL